jgi:transcription elongation factor GreA-like protein
VDALRCLGNAVVPQQAAAAIRELWDALVAHEEANVEGEGLTG